jgi:aspartyl protease family protein
VISFAKYAAFWLLAGGIGYLAFNAFVSPKVAVATSGSGTVVIERSHDQHFYVEAAINGHPVTFMVDTGATVVSVSEELARAIRLGPGVPAIFDTAAGRVEGRVVPEATVRVGGISVEGIRVGINSGGPAALLGQNFLNKVDLRQSPQRMTVRIPDSP